MGDLPQYFKFVRWMLTSSLKLNFTSSYLASPRLSDHKFKNKNMLVCFVCFLKIHRIVRRHQLQIHVQQKAVENSIDSNKQQTRQSTKSAKNCFHVFRRHDFMLHSIIFCFHIVFVANHARFFSFLLTTESLICPQAIQC